jgi:Arc/MetJ-type ribon-helix-helix transcriptional regulator
VTDWVPVRIPEDLYAEITALLKKKPLWLNEHDFIRDALREKLAAVNCKEAQ